MICTGDWCSRFVLILISNVTSDKRLLADWLGCSMKWLLGVSWLPYMFRKPHVLLQLVGGNSVFVIWPIYTGFFTWKSRLKWNEAYTHKLVVSWMRRLVMFSIKRELVMAIHEKGDGLLPFEWHSEGYHLTHSCYWTCEQHIMHNLHDCMLRRWVSS
jgi:hypothetical protein